MFYHGINYLDLYHGIYKFIHLWICIGGYAEQIINSILYLTKIYKKFWPFSFHSTFKSKVQVWLT